jgi:hypothetical protein
MQALIPRASFATFLRRRRIIAPHSNLQAVISMGDKSPKAKDKAKKQGAANKNQKKADAAAKASQPSTSAAKKGR